MRLFKQGLFILLSLIIITACDTNRVYDNSFSIPDQSWNKDSLLLFEVQINDTISLHNFYLNIRHNTDYPYSNIFFFINTSFPNGSAGRDTIEILLADKRGVWIGTGSGRVRDNQVLLRKNLRFPQTGIYSFSIEQAMRKNNLSGLEDLGIRIEKIE
ncbi:gliding motility lipoprotein GldH [Bacteroidota bacterium]